MLRKAISLRTAAACICILPTFSFALTKIAGKSRGTAIPNILNGGVMLTKGDDFCFVEGGIFVQNGDEVRALSADKGKNLNFYNDYIYFTMGS